LGQELFDLSAHASWYILGDEHLRTPYMRSSENTPSTHSGV
jgi:hypothetical protein